MGFTRSIWFNKLLRRLYKSVPFPWHFKQRLKEIYLRRPGAWKIRKKSFLQLVRDRKTLPMIVANAQQFDPTDPWVLVIDLRSPTPDQDPGSVRTLGILHLLREMRFRITFISDSEKPLLDYREVLEKQDINVIHGFDAARSHLAAAGGKYHFVLLSRPELAFRYIHYVRAFALYSQVIYDMVDLDWVRFEREMQLSGEDISLDVIAHFRRVELFNTASADLVLTITEEEKKHLLIEQPDAKVAVLPNIHDIHPSETPFAQRSGLLFIGGFWHKSHEEALIYFIKNILPRITEEIHDLVFYIIGSNIPASVESLRSATVEPLGFMADVTPYFERCRVFTAPLLFGAGMKGPVGRSMSHGLPVVTTQCGVEGMGLQHEKHLLIADNIDDFTACVVRLYSDEILWRRLSADALAHMEVNYSHAAAQKRMINLLSGGKMIQAQMETMGTVV